MAALVKQDKDLVIDNKRIEEVISNVVSFGKLCGLEQDISRPLWEKLIELSIKHEFKEIEAFNISN